MVGQNLGRQAAGADRRPLLVLLDDLGQVLVGQLRKGRRDGAQQIERRLVRSQSEMAEKGLGQLPVCRGT
jgi:hypothetical protein